MVSDVHSSAAHAVTSRAASYAWGPGLGSRATARSDWQSSLLADSEMDEGDSLRPQGEAAGRRSLHQKAGGVGGLLVVPGTATATDYVDSHAPSALVSPSGPPSAVSRGSRQSPWGPLHDRMGNIVGYRRADVSEVL